MKFFLLFITTIMITPRSYADNKNWVEIRGGYGILKGKRASDGYDMTIFNTLQENDNRLFYFLGKVFKETYYPSKMTAKRMRFGFGMRKLMESSQGSPLIWGANMFFLDKTTFNIGGTSLVYEMSSVGLELKNNAFETSANLYIPKNRAVIKNGWDLVVKKSIYYEPKSFFAGKHTFGAGTGHVNTVSNGRELVYSSNKLFYENQSENLISRVEYVMPTGSGESSINFFMGLKFGFGDKSQQRENKNIWDNRYDNIDQY